MEFWSQISGMHPVFLILFTMVGGVWSIYHKIDRMTESHYQENKENRAEMQELRVDMHQENKELRAEMQGIRADMYQLRVDFNARCIALEEKRIAMEERVLMLEAPARRKTS